MAQKQKIKPVLKGTTPKGVLVFPYLNKPDTKFKAEGEYRAKLKLVGADAATFLAEMEKAYDLAIDAAVEEQKAKTIAGAKTTEIGTRLAAKITRDSIKKASDKPYKPETDKDTGEETGAMLFTFKKKASFKNKDGEIVNLKVDLFDAAKQRIDPKKTLIYGGSTAKIAFEAMHFYTPALGAGLTIRLNGAQIIDLVSGGSRSADDYGFDDEGEGLPSEKSDGEEGGSAPADGEPEEF